MSVLTLTFLLIGAGFLVSSLVVIILTRGAPVIEEFDGGGYAPSNKPTVRKTHRPHAKSGSGSSSSGRRGMPAKPVIFVPNAGQSDTPDLPIRMPR